jgi:hypothetical protein
MKARTLQMSAVLLVALAIGVAWYLASSTFGHRYGHLLIPPKLPLVVPMGVPVLVVVLASRKGRWFESGAAFVLSIAASILGFAGAILGLALQCWFATCEI